jgi:hypothetical protein
MLTLVSPTDLEDDEEEVAVGDGYHIDKKILTFKLLVYDYTAQNIVATIMKVGSLRECNVALHLSMT